MEQVRLQRIEELSIREVRHGASAFAKDRETLDSCGKTWSKCVCKG